MKLKTVWAHIIKSRDVTVLIRVGVRGHDFHLFAIQTPAIFGRRIIHCPFIHLVSCVFSTRLCNLIVPYKKD